MLENKCTLLEAAEGLKAGQFIYIHRYINSDFEIQNVTVHADVSYSNTHKRSLDILEKIEKDRNFSIDIVRNAWIDEDGKEHTRKAEGRVLKTGIKETISATDKDFPEAIEKIRKGLTDPKKITDNFEKVGNSVYENSETKKIYLRNVLVHNKNTVRNGKYKTTCSARAVAISEAIRKTLPVGDYRSYVLDDEMITMPDKVNGCDEILPRFEYVSIVGNCMSSSSSSSED